MDGERIGKPLNGAPKIAQFGKTPPKFGGNSGEIETLTGGKETQTVEKTLTPRPVEKNPDRWKKKPDR